MMRELEGRLAPSILDMNRARRAALLRRNDVSVKAPERDKWDS